jgi:hypothetical protein
MLILIFAIFATLGVVLFSAEPAFAWGPSTHLMLGKAVLDQAPALGPYLASLLSSNPLDFLYGSIFADMHIGKNFFMFAKLAHNWKVGFSLKDNAASEKNMACAYGYLTHLAADTIAHNDYIPKKLVEHHALLGRGHIFFEGRFDSLLPDKDIHKFSKAVVREGASNNDLFLEQSISRTLFSFNTNKRLYRGLLTIQRFDGIQSYRRYRALSKNHISHREVEHYLQLSLLTVFDFLENARSAQCYAHDPHGKKAIKRANQLRAKLRRNSHSPHLLRDALEIVAVSPHRS